MGRALEIDCAQRYIQRCLMIHGKMYPSMDSGSGAPLIFLTHKFSI